MLSHTAIGAQMKKPRPLASRRSFGLTLPPPRASNGSRAIHRAKIHSRTMTATTTPKIVCYGEALWDCLPEGLFFGGAPINVARHLQRLGAGAYPATTLGEDFLGDEALDRLKGEGLSTDLVRRDPDLPTGTVKVRIDASGSATYTIAQPVAWDRIPVDKAVLERTRSARALVYGTLAQREQDNRTAIQELLKLDGPFKIYDVNLRPPFDDLALVAELARPADLLKVNEEELYRLLDPDSEKQPLEEAARRLADQTGVLRVCVTRAEKGAVFLDHDRWFTADGRPVEVRDTVGAGDGFLASFALNYLAGRHEPAKVLENACRFGEFIATRDGAVPAYDPKDWVLV